MCAHIDVVFTLFQVALMLPNTAMLRNLVDSGQHDDFLERETTKTATNSKGSSSKKKKKKKSAWRVTDCSSGAVWYWNDRLHVCMWVYEPKDVTSEQFIHLLRDAEDPFYLKNKTKNPPCFYSKVFVDEVTRRHTGIHDVNEFGWMMWMMRSSQQMLEPWRPLMFLVFIFTSNL